jgi:hypothetical protein
MESMIKIGNPSHWHQENGAGQQPLTPVAEVVAPLRGYPNRSGSYCFNYIDALFKEGWTRPQEKWREATMLGADGDW